MWVKLEPLMVECLLAQKKMLLEGSLKPYHVSWVLLIDHYAVQFRRVRYKSKLLA